MNLSKTIIVSFIVPILLSTNTFAASFVLACDYSNYDIDGDFNFSSNSSVEINAEAQTISGQSYGVTFSSTEIKWSGAGFIGFKASCNTCSGRIDRGTRSFWERESRTGAYVEGSCRKSATAF